MSLLTKIKEALFGRKIAPPANHEEMVKALDRMFPKSVNGQTAPKPNVKAEFLDDGYQEEYTKLEREDKGLKGIFGLD